jgi:hypothetical protein
MSTNSPKEERKIGYEKVPDFESLQKRHEDAQIELRKKKRYEHVAKRRATFLNNQTIAQDATE